jgi:hypothetical protein
MPRQAQLLPKKKHKQRLLPQIKSPARRGGPPPQPPPPISRAD